MRRKPNILKMVCLFILNLRNGILINDLLLAIVFIVTLSFPKFNHVFYLHTPSGCVCLLYTHTLRVCRLKFIHVSRYIHINHVTARIIEFEQLLTYEWTSLPYYLNYRNPQGSWNPEGSSIVNTKPILGYFKTPEKYLRFLKNNVDYQRKLKRIKDLLLE